jgi:hypothetical protein
MTGQSESTKRVRRVGDRAEDVFHYRHLAEHAVNEVRAVAANAELLGEGPEVPLSTCERDRLFR